MYCTTTGTKFPLDWSDVLILCNMEKFLQSNSFGVKVAKNYSSYLIINAVPGSVESDPLTPQLVDP